MWKSWVTKRWVLAAAAASGLLGLVLKVSEISRPGKSTASVPKHAAVPAARSSERHEASAPAGRGPSDWTPAMSAPEPEPEPTSPTDGAVREPWDTMGGLPAPPPSRHAADGSVREGGVARYQLGSRSHGANGVAPGGGRGRHRSDDLQAAVVGESGSARQAGGPAMNELRAPRAVAGQPPGTVPATSDTLPANTDVAFDSGEAASYPTDSQVEVPDVKKIAGPAGTISFWLQPEWGEGNHDDATFVQLGDSRLQVIKNVNFLRFEFLDDNGIPGGIGAPITEWKAGEWHQVTTTWNGSQFAMYVDGQLVSQTVHDGRVDLAPDTKLYIGSDFPESRPVAPGVIGKVDLQNRPLSPGEVANRYQSVAGGQGAQGTQPGRAPAPRR